MDVAAEIKKAIIELVGANPNLPMTATVVSVQGDTCTIKLLSELVLTDVRLKATSSDNADTLLLTPKIGSEVLVISQTGKLSGLFVLKVDEVEKINFKKNDFEIEINGTTGKMTLKKAGANFGSLINSLIDTMSAAQIVTPAGPGTINPATQLQLLNIKIAFNTILNSN